MVRVDEYPEHPIEALERSYPMRVLRQRLRRWSGGAGSAPGGEGIERDVQVLVDATVSLITERRVSQPWGLAGGEPGAVGDNWLLPGGDERRAERLPDKCTVQLRAGDVLRMLTPGGGAVGCAAFHRLRWSGSEHLDRTADAGCTRQATVGCEQRPTEVFGERHIGGVVGRDVRTELVGATHEWQGGHPNDGEISQIVDCGGEAARGEVAGEPSAPQHRHDLDVDEIRRSELGCLDQAPPCQVAVVTVICKRVRDDGGIDDDHRSARSASRSSTAV